VSLERPAIRLAEFEGPLALLLSLIEQRRLDITEISLAAVADQYLDAVRRLPEPAPDLLAEFLAIGSRLLLIKSRALLPRLSEAPADDDPFVELQDRITAYRMVRAAADRLQLIEQRGEPAFPAAPRPLDALPPPLAPLSPRELSLLARAVLGRRRETEAVREGAVQRVAVDDRARWILEALAEHARVAWESVAGETRDEVVASFLAVLELYKRGRLLLEQALPNGPLWLARRHDRGAVATDGGAAGGESKEA